MSLSLFLLHDIGFPEPGPLFPLVIVLEFVGAITWVRRLRLKPEDRLARARPPRWLILGGGVTVAILGSIAVWLDRSPKGVTAGNLFLLSALPFAWPFLWLDDNAAFFFGGALAGMTILTSLWSLQRLITGRWNEPAKLSDPPPPLVLEADAQSEKAACDKCRAAASLPATGEALTRIAQTSEGPRFLYRCVECRSYWLKALNGIAVISALHARLMFPSAVKQIAK